MQNPTVVIPFPSIVTTLSGYTEGNTLMFRCPEDQTYFVTYGTSYEYPQLTLQGKTRQQVLVTSSTANGSSSRVAISWDAGTGTHAPAGEDGRETSCISMATSMLSTTPRKT